MQIPIEVQEPKQPSALANYPTIELKQESVVIHLDEKTTLKESPEIAKRASGGLRANGVGIAASAESSPKMNIISSYR